MSANRPITPPEIHIAESSPSPSTVPTPCATPAPYANEPTSFPFNIPSSPNSPPTNARNNSTTTSPTRRPRAGTLSAIDPAPWQRSSIRIRRGPSLQSISTVRSNTPSNTNPNNGTASGNGNGNDSRPVSGSGSVSRDFAPGASPAPRARAGSIGRNPNLRHEQRDVGAGRRRSSSDPTRSWNRETGVGSSARDAAGVRRKPVGANTRMPDVVEEIGRGSMAIARPTLGVPGGEDVASEGQNSGSVGRGFGRRLSVAGMLRFPSFRPSSADEEELKTQEEQYEDDMADILDTVDPQVSTLNTLNNVQNSLFVPDLGRFLNRRPTYTLSRFPTKITENSVPTEGSAEEEDNVEEDEDIRPDLGRMSTIASITSHMDDTHFAVLPHGERLRGWSAEERAELNDHVRHLLHSRREKFKRGMKGFGQYVRKPLGFLVTLYATLITLFGLAWVLFLIGWISVGSRKDYLVNVIDNIMVALFAIMGDGLAPFRAVDTYHMCFIAHYHHLTWRLRRERALAPLANENDLPALTVQDVGEVEKAEEKMGELSVLTAEQQKKLVHHQKKFSRSHTFYKPHETETHFAFPLRLLVAVVVLLDCHSCLQIALGTCTWAISYHVRPFALTTVILCFSITCNITAGVVITIGDRQTRKKDVLERMFRQKITAEAMHHIEKRRVRRSMELERELEMSRSLDLDREMEMREGLGVGEMDTVTEGVVDGDFVDGVEGVGGASRAERKEKGKGALDTAV